VTGQHVLDRNFETLNSLVYTQLVLKLLKIILLRIRNQLSKFELGVVKESEEEFRIVLKNSE
jgi:hypothetical protein